MPPHTPEFLKNFQFRCWPASGRMRDAKLMPPWVYRYDRHLIINTFATSAAAHKIYDIFLQIPYGDGHTKPDEWRAGYTTRSDREGRSKHVPIDLTRIEFTLAEMDRWFDIRLLVPPRRPSINHPTRHYQVFGRIAKAKLQELTELGAAG